MDEHPIHCKHSWHTCSICQENLFQICPCDVCLMCTVELYWGPSLRCIDNCTGKCSLDWILAFYEFQPRREHNQRGLSQHMVSTLGYWSSHGCVKCRIVATSLFLFGLDSLSQPASLQSCCSRCLRSVVFPAESRHRGTERARGAKSEPSPTDIWEETASSHSEECCPHYKAHSSGHSSPVGQWHTCFLWPVLLGVLTSGRVVSFG